MEGVALRLWNVYGPGQALSNPYTGRARDLRLAAAQRPAADDLRGRRSSAATSSMSRTSPEAFVLALEHPQAAGRGLQHRQRRGPLGRARSATLLARGDGPAGSRARDRRQGARRRHPALHRRHRQGAATSSASRAAARLRRRPRRTGRMGRAAAGRGPGRPRPGGSSKRGGWSHDGGGASPARPRRPVLDHRRRRLHRLEPRRPAAARRPRRHRLRRAGPAGRRAQPRLAAGAPRRADLGRRSADVRDARRARGARPRTRRRCSTSRRRSR